jgi:Zn-dependent protease with chaperone function
MLLAVAPAAVAAVAAVVVFVVARRVRPATAAIVLATTAAALAVAAVSAASLTAFSLAAPSTWARWCRRVVGGDVGVRALAGIGLAGIVAWRVGAGVVHVVRLRRAVTRAAVGEYPVAVLDTDEPVAYARPGRHPQVVVSSGLLRRLDERQRRCVLAHERAHLDGRHHLLVGAAAVAAAVVPLVRPVAAATRRATERAADEAAAAAVGDRRLVAETVARAALARHDWVPAIGGGSVLERCHAMLEPPVRPLRTTVATLVAVVAAAVAAASVQVHHLAEIAVHAAH